MRRLTIITMSKENDRERTEGAAKGAVKLKLDLLHKVGLAVLAVGIGILIFGLNVLSKYKNIQDISELELKDIKKGMYVKATISGVLTGYPVDGEETGRGSEPIGLHTEQSPNTSDPANETYFLMELGEDSGEYVCVIIDEFLDTDLYYQILTGGDTPYELEGIVTYSEKDEQIVMDGVSALEEQYSDIYFQHRRLTEPNEENVSPCCIELKPLAVRKMWWLYSIPFMFAGTAIFFIGGKPFERVK